MKLKSLSKKIIYYSIISIYALLYILMLFIESLHERTTEMLILGAILIIGFVFLKGISERSKTVKLITYIVLITLLIQFFAEFLHGSHDFFEVHVIHVIVHVSYAFAYLAFGILVYKETSKYSNNMQIRKASFDYNETILIEIHERKKRVHIELSDRIVARYGMDSSSYYIDYKMFGQWVKDDQSIISDYIDNLSDINDILNQIIYLNIPNIDIEIPLYIKGLYKIGHKYILLGYDHSNIEKLEHAVESSNLLRLELLNNLQLGVKEIELVSNSVGQITDYIVNYANETFLSMMHLDADNIQHKKASELNPSSYKLRLDLYRRCIEDGSTVYFDTVLETNQRWYSIKAYPTSKNHVVVIYQDIHDVIEVNKKNEYLATHNKWNDLLNYHGLMNKIGTYGTFDRAVALYVTVDNFNEIMSYYGIEYAEALVIEISKLNKDALNSNDILANIKYNHLILVMINPSDEKIDQVIEFSKRAVYQKYNVLDVELYAKMNIGYALSDETTKDLSALFVKAQIANTIATKSEHNTLVKFENHQEIDFHKNIEMANKLIEAIEDNVIDVAFQKIIDSRTSQTIYVEALARWVDPNMGYISPDQFMNLAKESSIIDILDEYLLDLSFKKYKTLKTRTFNDAMLTINLSPSFLFREDVESVLIEHTNKYDLNPSNICLEISEDTFVHDIEDCIKIIKGVKALGFKIAIDDFGSKYSSIGILDSIPYDVLKLDGIFVNKIHKEAVRSLIQTIIHGVNNENKSVIIEKIESKLDADAFNAIGCHIHQGYYYHKPETFNN